jgi:hypothetical protein
MTSTTTSNIDRLNKEIVYENADLAQKNEDTVKTISFIHFNDVYNIESRTLEPVGGASRFVTAVNDILSDNPSTIVFFSGDAFNPSMCKCLCSKC